MILDVAAFVLQCIADNNLHAFYTCWEWLRLRVEVLRDDKYECQDCKEHGIYTRATTVHHEKHVKDHPELALSKHYIDEHGQKQRNLRSLCTPCHEKRHPERRLQAAKHKPLTPERW